MTNLKVIIENREGKLLVSSRVVAEQLGKEHSDVMRKCREVLGVGEFSESSYTNSQNKEQPELLLTKDGFILLCMNYQGYNDFKRAYIAKFNEMEQQLHKPMSQLEITAANAIALVEHEKRMNQIEQAQEQTEKQLTAIQEIVVVRPDQTKKWMKSIVNKIVHAKGGSKDLYSKIKTETYQLLNQRLGVNVYTRRANKSKVGINMPTIDIILSDKKLTEGYIAILKEYAIKYGVGDVA